ncbi:MAG: DUF4197 domain-containing protein [Balneolaceae bacterium]|nr:MAG: DUF4197 domain-containing protein [Balneolaceae bacterium]
MRRSFTVITLLLLTVSCAGLEDLLEQNTGPRPLTQAEIINGLKQALEVSAQNAAVTASREGGYLNNADLFIRFPEEASFVDKQLRDLGFGHLVDDFVTSLNRSAELAAREAAPIFVNAVRNMTIRDGLEILQGESNAATMYLRTNTEAELIQAFTPVITSKLNETAATRYWSDLIGTYNRIPLVRQVNPDLVGYATESAMDGLFLLVEREEAEIRRDPAKRVTDLLRRVFGSPEAQQ